MEKIVVEKGVLEKSARKGGAEAALEGYFDTMGIPGYRNTIHVISSERLVVGCGFCTFGDPLNLQLVRIVQSRTHNSTV